MLGIAGGVAALSALALALKISSRLIFRCAGCHYGYVAAGPFCTHPTLLSIQPLQARKKRTHLELHLL